VRTKRRAYIELNFYLFVTQFGGYGKNSIFYNWWAWKR